MAVCRLLYVLRDHMRVGVEAVFCVIVQAKEAVGAAQQKASEAYGAAKDTLTGTVRCGHRMALCLFTTWKPPLSQCTECTAPQDYSDALIYLSVILHGLRLPLSMVRGEGSLLGREPRCPVVRALLS